MWNVKNKTKTKLINAENRFMVVRGEGGWGVGEMGKGGGLIIG